MQTHAWIMHGMGADGLCWGCQPLVNSISRPATSTHWPPINKTLRKEPHRGSIGDELCRGRPLQAPSLTADQLGQPSKHHLALRGPSQRAQVHSTRLSDSPQRDPNSQSSGNNVYPDEFAAKSLMMGNEKNDRDEWKQSTEEASQQVKSGL